MSLPSLKWLPVCALATSALMAQAQSEPIGYVKTVSGEAWVTTAGQRQSAKPGLAVQIGSQLKTSAAGSLGVTFKDNTVMSFGPDTEMTVDEYLYAPAKKQFKLGARMSQGTLNYVSGVMAKLKPDAVAINTPSGIIGVRGTQFLLQVAPGAVSLAPAAPAAPVAEEVAGVK